MSDLNELFASSDVQHPSDVVKQLFDPKNPKTKSDLTPRQISIIARLYLMAKLTDLPELEDLLNEFVTLRISTNRKSRGEFVTSFQNADMINRMNGMIGQNQMFGGRRP